MGLTTRWDVDLEDYAQIDREDKPNEMQHNLVGVPLVTPKVESVQLRW